MKIKHMIVLVVMVGLLVSTAGYAAKEPAVPTIPKVEVRYAMGPYADWSYPIIAFQKGWTEEVGISIEPKPYGMVLEAHLTAPILLAGTVDFMESFTKFFTPVLPETTRQKMFLYTDMSLGNAIVADPDKYKSLEEFINEGYSVDEAYKKTIGQLKGKTIPSEIDPANKGMLYYAFDRAGMDIEEDIELLLIEDSKILAMMLSGQIDVATPAGIPTIVQLMLKGFKPIITNAMEIKYAEPSPDSKVLETTLYAGIAATEEWLEENHDTALRICGVWFRVVDFIVDHPDEAAAIHLPFLNGIAGTDLGVEQLKMIYSTMQPFTTFERQSEWFLNKKSAYYWEYPVMVDIKMWERKGLLPEGKYTARDITVADEFYLEMVRLKLESEQEIRDTRTLLAKSEAVGKDMTKAIYLMERAEHYHSTRNYLDAQRFGQAATQWANYLLEQ